MKEIIIPLSKKKIVLLFLGAIGFVVLFFWLIQITKTQSSLGSFFIKIISVIGIMFFGVCGIYAVVRFFDKKPGLIISDEGITDNSSAIGAGLIKWENIANVSVTEIYDQKILTIEIINAEEVLLKQFGFKKFLMSLNKDYFKSPIQISSNALKCNFQELYSVIEKQLSIRRIV